jgi:hypothetical protein
MGHVAAEEGGRETAGGEMSEVSMRAETACPRCGGRLVISNERRLLVGTAVLWLNCGDCGLFQLCEPTTRARAERRAGG